MLVVEPHGSDRALAGTDRNVTLADIASVEVAPIRPLGHVFGARLRRHLLRGGERRELLRRQRVKDVDADPRAGGRRVEALARWRRLRERVVPRPRRPTARGGRVPSIGHHATSTAKR
jgi:hypothetical protein